MSDTNIFYSTILNLAAQIDKFSAPHLAPLGAKAYEITKPLYAVVDNLSGAVNQDPSVVMFMLCLVASYPLAFIHRFLPSKFFRHLYTIFIGVFFCFFVFKWFALHAVIASLVPYIFMMILPGKLAVSFTWIFSFSYLSCCHIYRMATDYLGWSLDFSCIMMLVCLKTIGCAYNIYDARKDINTVSDFHKEKMLVKFPNPLEYFGFIFFYPSVMSGPVIEIRDYIEFIDGTHNPPFSFSAAAKRFLMAIICMLFFMAGSPSFNREQMALASAPFASEKVLVGDNFVAQIVNYTSSIFLALQAAVATPALIAPFLGGLFGRLGVSHLTSICMRMKYYVGWYLAEGACVTAGFGYSGKNKDGESTWKKIDQADIIGFEFSTNLKGIATNWNKSVSRWLRNYVFTRVNPDPKITKKPVRGADRLKATLLTFTVSAMWHGFYPGYFFFWTALAIADQIGSMLHDKLRPRLLDKESWNRDQDVNFYRVCGFVLSQAGLSYFAGSFHMLSWADTINYFNSFYWIGHYIVAVLLILVAVLPAPKRVKKNEEEKKDVEKKEDKKHV